MNRFIVSLEMFLAAFSLVSTAPFKRGLHIRAKPMAASAVVVTIPKPVNSSEAAPLNIEVDRVLTSY